MQPCPDHYGKRSARAEAYHGMYGRKWRAYRLAFLAEHPLCRECEREGRLTPATEVDHVQRHCGDYGLFWDTSNHQGLCKSHHSAKTIREVNGHA